MDKLLYFLEGVIENIKSDTIDDFTKTELINFYMKCNNPVDLDDPDVLKYLCMGWFIYNELEKKTSCANSSVEN